MVAYKRNLLVFSSRYGDLERRVIRRFSESSDIGEIWLISDLDILLRNLLEDGLLQDTGDVRGYGSGGGPVQKRYCLTDAGRAYIEAWFPVRNE